MRTPGERFMALVRKEGGHWIWTSATSRGYPTFWLNGKSQRADRVSYELFKGAIPPGEVVRHLCFHILCCNPAHLALGTQHQNILDEIKAQRFAGMRYSHSKPGARPG